MNKLQIIETIRYIKLAKAIRGSYTDNAAWLVNMAINRRAGWPDDPSESRGSCMPVNGRYPKKAIGDTYHHLKLMAREINTPRLIVRSARLGEWKKLILTKIPYRIWDSDNLYSEGRIKP